MVCMSHQASSALRLGSLGLTTGREQTSIQSLGTAQAAPRCRYQRAQVSPVLPFRRPRRRTALLPARGRAALGRLPGLGGTVQPGGAPPAAAPRRAGRAGQVSELPPGLDAGSRPAAGLPAAVGGRVSACGVASRRAGRRHVAPRPVRRRGGGGGGVCGGGTAGRAGKWVSGRLPP